jgi:hypothetical protein
MTQIIRIYADSKKYIIDYQIDNICVHLLNLRHLRAKILLRHPQFIIYNS